MKQVLCMKWGTDYGPEYVNNLYGMVQRHVTPPFRFVCMTDDPQGIRDEVETLPCPAIGVDHPRANRGWRKLTLWQSELEGLSGDVLFLDLDIVIVDNIDELFSFGEDFCVMPNATQPGKRIGNTSVYRFTVGSHPEVWADFSQDPCDRMDHFPNSQTYLSRTISRMSFFPEAWCRLFKVHCVPPWPLRYFVPPRLPSGTKIVAFPGKPNPPDAAVGRWPAAGFKRFYKIIRPAAWVDEHWRP